MRMKTLGLAISIANNLSKEFMSLSYTSKYDCALCVFKSIKGLPTIEEDSYLFDTFDRKFT